MSELVWEQIDDYHKRAKVYGGWLVKAYEDVIINDYGPHNLSGSGYEWRVSMTFVPDPQCNWAL